MIEFLIFVINFLFSVVYIMLALRAILPWLPHNKSNPFIKPVYVLTEPVLSVIKAGLPPNRIGMDVSPYIVIILLWLVQQVILKLIS